MLFCIHHLAAVDNARVESNVVRANHCIIAEDCGDSSFYSNDLYPFGWGFSERSIPALPHLASPLGGH